VNYLWRCIIIPSNEADLTRQIWATLDPAYNDEFKIGLTAQAKPDVITHYMSAGWVPETSTYLMPFSVWQLSEDGQWVLADYNPGDPNTVAEGCRIQGLEVTDKQVAAIWLSADVTDEPIDTALGRLSLARYAPPEPALETEILQ
jgi:hypothetical protein